MRKFLIRWMYATAIVHLLVGALLPWIGNLDIFNAYHQGIETAFWGGPAPAAARAQQVWWISLFGPTVQGLSIWMIALIHIADRYRSAWVWAVLVLGIVVWAPQDMLISLRMNCWTHVWVDSFAVAVMVPPLVWLWRHDRMQGT
ncbi:MAG: cell division protein [Burkholderiales bacterium]|nr:cell division protein [Burkholderiales bacterium]